MIASWVCRVTGVGVLVAVLAGCGGGGAAGPSSAAPVSPSAASGAPAAVDPCQLLTAPDVTPYLGNEKPVPARQDEAGKPLCAWGDGEFRSVRLSVWSPSAPDELSKQAKRTVDVGGGTGYVTGEADFDCAVGTITGGRAVLLEIISADKTQWCPETAATLKTVLGRLPH